MKKAFIFVLLAVLLAASGCAGAAESPLLKSNIWEVDIDQPGYECTGIYHTMSWQGEGLSVSLDVYPAGYAEQSREDEETLEYKGRKYLLSVSEVCWEGIGGTGTGGTRFFRALRWQSSGYAYSFSAESGESRTPLDIVCPENALLAEQGDYSLLKGLTLQRELWSGGFRSGEKFVRFELCPPPFGEQMIKGYLSGDMDFYKADGFGCYVSSKERLPEEPNGVAVLWNTDAGAICICGSVPYDERNNVPERVWDFINAGLARSITEQLGAEVIPLPAK